MVWNDFDAEPLQLHFPASIYDSEDVRCEGSVEEAAPSISENQCSAGFFHFNKPVRPSQCRCQPSNDTRTPITRGRLHSDGRDCYRKKRKPKSVRFADDFGLNLIEVRHYVISSDEGFRWACSATSVFDDPRRWEESVKEESQTCLRISFTQPGVEPGFFKRVQEQSLSLENCLTDNDARKITGVVRVANKGYNKRVVVRSSTNNWVTYEDVEARYIPNSSDGTTDRFMFSITVPWFMAKGGRVDFAVRYICENQTYWDNNGDKNYTVFC